MRGRLDLDGWMLNFDEGTLILDGGKRPPNSLSTDYVFWVKSVPKYNAN